jgi:putative restriction endonuclease
MTVRLVVAVTDGDWFEHLRHRNDLEEVNFWAPSAVGFRALAPGELFLFKLHAPRNYIVGGGTFVHANALPCSLAWEAFGEANGARSLVEMRARIARYRKTRPDDRSDFTIGCRILAQPFFFPEDLWIPVPESWAPNIVSFKGYSTDEPDGMALWNAIQAALGRLAVPVLEQEGARYGEPVPVRPRLGQGAFRVLVTDSYRRRCAVSGERTLPALDAAHIRPYGEGGEHQLSNGILLRRDIHSLFDAGYVTITPEHSFEVSRRIREEFENGRDYYALHGRPIAAPDNPVHRPERAALIWHNENRFMG